MTVTATVPVAAVLVAVNVRELVEVVGLVAKFAVTPLGRGLADKVTEPVKAFDGVTVMVVPLLLPCTTETEAGAADRLKSAVGFPARALIRPDPFGLPQPVAKSYPVVAEKPLLPLVISWKSVP